MKRIAKYIIVIMLFIGLLPVRVTAQQVNTLYFMENVPVRHYLNPAFQPLSNFYLGITPLAYTQFGLGNNSIALKDLIYKDPLNPNGKPIWFLNENGDKGKFMNALKSTTLLNTNLELNLLDFGFRTGRAYWSFGITEKIDGQIGIPKDLMNLVLYGTPAIDENIYNLQSLEFDMTAYTEAALGYSRVINDKWTVGGKLKFLYGNFNISMTNSYLDMNANIDEWNLKGKGVLNTSSPAMISGYDLPSLVVNGPDSPMKFLKPSGMGAGFDLGLTFKPIEALTLSAAVTDVGMIHWTKNTKNISYSIDHTYTGLNNLNLNTNFDNMSQLIEDSILTPLKNSATADVTDNQYNTYTSPKLNVGAEYGFFDNKLSLGVLSRTLKHNKNLFEEVTASINGKPVDWFNLSLSYSFMNGRMSNIGAGVGLRTGFLNWFFTADYISLNNSEIPISGISADLPPFLANQSIKVPYVTNKMNFAVGINFVFGNRKDSDKDGIINRKDKCPDTPFGVIVDKKGCPVDTDGDGVPDYLDKCPNTPKEAYNMIDQDGCPLDTDSDGVADYMDKCPDTPVAARAFVDSVGCSKDTDHDGVYDYLDKCPDTPEGVKVDSVGCPIDTDGDGVADYLDLCPDTPAAARGMVDKNGCPLDTDSDGVADYLDLCPNTPLAARGFVDKNGCPLDSDDDGVPDYLDKCPKTPSEARGMVDEHGCPRDTDGDGVPDYLDNCPKTPGVASNHGCPELKKEIRTLFQKALQGIQFETGKDVIKPKSFPILNQIAKVLEDNPTYLIEVRGHTDNVGKADMNKILSVKRAMSVRKYLIEKGIDQKRISANGYGDTMPVASNKTAAGRAQNRRVEFVVTFEEVSYEDVK